MTNDEFNDCKLPKRLDFRTAEAARFVLVLGGSVTDATKLYGVSLQALESAIALFRDSTSE